MKRVSSSKPFSLCVQPTFLIGTYDADGTPNFCPITWVSVTYGEHGFMLVISMNGSKKTKDNLARSKRLSANLVSTDMLTLLDYFGSCSGKDGAKDDLPYDYEDGICLDVPTLSMSRWVYECQVVRSVQNGDSTTYFCDISNVQVIDSMAHGDGLRTIDLTRLDPVVYSGMYHSIGKCMGSIGDFYSPRR